MEDIEVRVRGYVDANWSDRFGGLALTHNRTGDTIITGSIRDQSALIGLVNMISGLGLRLVSVTSVEALSRTQGGQGDVNPQ